MKELQSNGLDCGYHQIMCTKMGKVWTLETQRNKQNCGINYGIWKKKFIRFPYDVYTLFPRSTILIKML